MTFPMARPRRWLAASMFGVLLTGCSSTNEPLSGLPVTLTERVFPAPPPGTPQLPPVVTPITAFKDTVIASTVQQPVCGQIRANAGIQASRLVMTLTVDQSGPPPPCALISGVVVYTLTVHGVPPGHYLAVLETMTITDQATTITPVSSAAIALP